MTEITEEALNARIIEDRKNGLTIDQLHEKYQQYSRSKIGRLCHGIKAIPKPFVNVETPLENAETTEIGYGVEQPLEQRVEPLESHVQNPEIPSQNPNIPGSRHGDMARTEVPLRPFSVQRGASPSTQYVDMEIFLESMRMAKSRAKTPSDKAFVEDVIGLALKRQANKQNNPGIGNPSMYSQASMYPRGDRLRNAMAEAVEQRTWERMMGMGDSRGNDGISVRDLLAMQTNTINMMKGQGRGSSPSLSDLWGVVSSMQNSNMDMYDKLSSRLSSMSSSVPAEVAVQLKKIDVDLEKWRTEQAMNVQKWDTIGRIVSPFAPVASQLLGQGAIQNPQGNPQTTNLQCVKCGHVWTVATKQKGIIQCPECGTKVKKELFAGAEPLRFKCQHCGIEMGIPADKIQELAEKGIDKIPAKCPKCGGVTNLVPQVDKEQPKAKAETEPKEQMVNEIRPHYS